MRERKRDTLNSTHKHRANGPSLLHACAQRQWSRWGRSESCAGLVGRAGNIRGANRKQVGSRNRWRYSNAFSLANFFGGAVILCKLAHRNIVHVHAVASCGVGRWRIEGAELRKLVAANLGATVCTDARCVRRARPFRPCSLGLRVAIFHRRIARPGSNGLAACFGLVARTA